MKPKKPTVENIVKKSFSFWKPSGNAEIDSRMLELFRSGFFMQYQQLTEQVFMILDQRDMRYTSISDNVTAVSGLKIEDLYAQGAFFLIDRWHPEDMQKMPLFFPMLVRALRSLPVNQIMNCRVSYDYRVRFTDDRYHWVMQHNIPITLDENTSVVHALLVITDTTAYKRTDCCCYNVTNYADRENPSVLLHGAVGDSAAQRITEREKEIIRLTAEGVAEKQIADKLNISLQTVKTHRRNLFRKASVRSSPELVSFAMANLII